MSEQVRSVRLTSETWEELRSLASRLSHCPDVNLHGQVTISTVLRMALVAGLRELQQRYQPDVLE